MAYLDSSAFLKGPLREPEFSAAAVELAKWVRLTSSALLRTESLRTALRKGPTVVARVREELQGVDLIAIGDGVIAAAAVLEPAGLRTLDAIHLATALRLGGDLGVLIAYDQRLLEAAAQHGIPTVSPGA